MNRCVSAILFLAVLFSVGCSSSPELVSQSSVEDKIARLRIGQSDKSEVESIFGVDHGSDRTRWAYNFDDKQFDVYQRSQGLGIGVLPVNAGTVSTNTRAVVTLTFTPAGIVKRIEVARFFEEPFINDYWYLLKEPAKNPLDSVAAMGESAGFKVSSTDKTAATFTFEDPSSKARVHVKLEGQILRLTSRNPHHRLANEYRVYVKRENALTNAIADSELIQ